MNQSPENNDKLFHQPPSLTSIFINDGISDLYQFKNKYGVARSLISRIIQYRMYKSVYDEIEAGYLPTDKINLDKINMDLGLAAAVKGGHFDLVEYFVSKGASDFRRGIRAAAENNHKDLVDYCIAKKPYRWYIPAAAGAAYGGHRDLLDYIISRSPKKSLTPDEWCIMMNNASTKGHMHIIEYCISKGADSWDDGLFNAAYTNNKKLMEYYISKGASDWKQGMQGAIIADNIEFVEYFLERGVNIQTGLQIATKGKCTNMIEYFLKKL